MLSASAIRRDKSLPLQLHLRLLSSSLESPQRSKAVESTLGSKPPSSSSPQMVVEGEAVGRFPGEVEEGPHLVVEVVDLLEAVVVSNCRWLYDRS